MKTLNQRLLAMTLCLSFVSVAANAQTPSPTLSPEAPKKLKPNKHIRRTFRCVRDLGKKISEAVEENRPYKDMEVQMERILWELSARIESSGVDSISKSDPAHCRETLARLESGAPVPAFDLQPFFTSTDAVENARYHRVRMMSEGLSNRSVGTCGAVTLSASLAVVLELGLGVHTGACRMQNYNRFVIAGIDGILGLGLGVAVIGTASELDFYNGDALTGRTAFDDEWEGIIFALSSHGKKADGKPKRTGGGIGIGGGLREHVGRNLKILPLGVAYKRMLNDLVGITQFGRQGR